MHLRMEERNIYISAYRYRDIHMYIFCIHIHIIHKYIYICNMLYILYAQIHSLYTYAYIFKYIYSPYTFLCRQESVLKCSLNVLSIGLIIILVKHLCLFIVKKTGLENVPTMCLNLKEIQTRLTPLCSHQHITNGFYCLCIVKLLSDYLSIVSFPKIYDLGI